MAIVKSRIFAAPAPCEFSAAACAVRTVKTIKRPNTKGEAGFRFIFMTVFRLCKQAKVNGGPRQERTIARGSTSKGGALAKAADTLGRATPYRRIAQERSSAALGTRCQAAIASDAPRRSGPARMNKITEPMPWRHQSTRYCSSLALDRRRHAQRSKAGGAPHRPRTDRRAARSY
jgi:hypothetical protein